MADGSRTTCGARGRACRARPEGDEQRRDLPWVLLEKEYEFDTEDGRKTLAELFDGRSQLLAYNIMFGPDYELGECPGCTNLGDELSATHVHLRHRDVSLICFSRAAIDRLIAYKERMGWEFPYVTYMVMAPDPFVARYHSLLLQRTPKPQPDEPRSWRKDEYPTG